MLKITLRNLLVYAHANMLDSMIKNLHGDEDVFNVSKEHFDQISSFKETYSDLLDLPLEDLRIIKEPGDDFAMQVLNLLEESMEGDTE